MKLQARSIPFWIFLSLISFGIIFIIWWYKITKEIIEEVGVQKVDSPELNLVWLILSGGLYYFWWAYKTCKYLSTIERRKNIEPDFWAPLFSLYFGIFLHQSRINFITSCKPDKAPAKRVTTKKPVAKKPAVKKTTANK